MKKLVGLLGLLSAVLLSACGGGGGSSGDTQERYSITLRADRVSLPLNIENVGITRTVDPAWAASYLGIWYIGGVGVNRPYTTALYVSAKEGNDAIQNGTDTFACRVDGVGSGSLYYLTEKNATEDIGYGKLHDITSSNPDDTVDVTVTNYLWYPALTLDSLAGGASFYFHAKDVAGTARVTCSVTDPRDNRVYSKSVDITVGSVGLPGSMEIFAQEPGYLGVQGNLTNIRNSNAIQTFVWDDANQPVPDPSLPNLRVRILRPAGELSGAWTGASLLAGAASTSCPDDGDVPGGYVSVTCLQVRTVAGLGLFTLSSGPNPGGILLEFATDRSDNDVSNGIQVPIKHYYSFLAVEDIGKSTLAFSSLACLAHGTQGMPFVCGLNGNVSGGVPPYKFTAQTALPSGLSLVDGVISGTPLVPGTYQIPVAVTDANNTKATGMVTITVDASPALILTAANVPPATVGVLYSFGMTVSGGVGPYTWTLPGGAPPGLRLGSSGTSAVISGTPAAEGDYAVAVLVTDSLGTSATATVAIKVNP
ncbi:MAG: putative Ig domain-containing protein [Desulfovibrionaceae bacterium]|nr:putative Ig domain-containing protein [Desulfovibrionaceae bacterium]